MNNVSQYYGVVTLELLSKNKRKLLSRQLNEGTINLFSAYAAALTGQNISNLVPNTVDIGGFSEDANGKIILNSFESVLNTTGALASVVYVSDTEDESYKSYGVPFTRVTTSITSLMIVTDVTNDDYLVLKSYSNKILATIKISDELAILLNELSDGSQFIVIWDLYVTNKSNENTNVSTNIN